MPPNFKRYGCGLYIFTHSLKIILKLLSGTKNKAGSYYASLDVLRFIAVLVSFLTHSKISDFLHGHTFFFLVSGFILTNLAQKEYDYDHKFSLLNFIMRRVLRTVPVYYLILFVGFILVPAFSDKAVSVPNPIYYLTFTANYINDDHIFILTLLWAISVQEQFYLFISLVYRFLYKYLIYVIVLMFGVSFLYKYIAIHEGWNLYSHTLNHFVSFGSGVLLSIAVQRDWLKRLYRLPKWVNALIYILIGGILYFSTSLYTFFWWSYLDNLVVSLCFSYVILEQCFFSNRIVPLERFTSLQYLGRISYGLYCYQGIVITFGNVMEERLGLGLNPYALVAVNFLCLIAISHISYQYFESRFLGLKEKFRNYPSLKRPALK